MKTIQKKRLSPRHKRPSKVRLLKRLAKVEVFGDHEPHLVDLDKAENVAQYRWNVNGKGYAQACIAGHSVTLYRFVFGPVPDGLEVDHINQDKRDNRRVNLRAVTNNLNKHNCAARGKSEFKGVSWDKVSKKWKSQITFNGNKSHLGLFTNEADAAHVYDQAVIQHYGADAVTNFPHKETGNGTS